MNPDRPAVLVTARDFFGEMLGEAYTKCKLRPVPRVHNYLLTLLQEYISADQLFVADEKTGERKEQTRAELLLTAMSSQGAERLELLKRLGDTSLYVSGFFGDSLSRKTVDVDYYAGMGAVAYDSLAHTSSDQLAAQVYGEFATKFLAYVDVLTVISQKCMVQSDQNLLRLYERYMKTGSELARDHLLEKGLIPAPRSSGGGMPDQ